MRLIKASNGKTKLNISKKEWQQIGRTAGWLRTKSNNFTHDSYDIDQHGLHAFGYIIVHKNGNYYINVYDENDMVEQPDVKIYCDEDDGNSIYEIRRVDNDKVIPLDNIFKYDNTKAKQDDLLDYYSDALYKAGVARMESKRD